MKILLTGTYSSFNKGDAAMEISVASACQGIFTPVPDVTILSPFPKTDAPFYHPIPVRNDDRRRLILATFNLMRGIIWRLIHRGNFAKSNSVLLSKGFQLTAQNDVIIDLSGDMLTEDYGPHVAYSHYIPILRALILGKPYMICAQSIGPFRFTKPLARLILNRAAVITVRDPITLDYLKEIGIRSELVTLTADVAFTLAPATPDVTAKHLHQAGISDDGRPMIGVSVSNLVADKYDRRVGSPGAFVSMIAQVVGAFAKESNMRVLFVGHVTGPTKSKDDRIICRQVCDAMPEDVEAHVLDADLRPDEIKGVISKCSLFVGTRMHANIAALSSHIPTVAISYSHKTPGIMQACGVPQFVTDVDTVTSEILLDTLRKLSRGHQEISQTLQQAVAGQRQQAIRNFQILGDLMAWDTGS